MTDEVEIVAPGLLPALPQQPASENPVDIYLARLAPGSRPTQQRALELLASRLTAGQLVARQVPWHQLRYQHTAALRASLAETQAPATANRHLSALRAVLKESWRLGLMTAEDYARAIDVENIKGSRLPAGRHVEDGELVALVSACMRDKSPAGVRDAAMLAVAFTAGLRLAELVSLDLDIYNDADGSIRVLGKGNKERLAYMQNGGLYALRAWLGLRGLDDGALFCPINKSGKINIGRMTGHAVYKRFHKRAKESGLTAFSPHDGRRTWIGNLLDRGADIATVQAMAGHASVTTTARYDRRPESAKQKAAGLLHFPFRA